MASDSFKTKALYVAYVISIIALSYSCFMPEVGVVAARQSIPQIIERHFDNSMLILPSEFTKVEKNFMSQNFFGKAVGTGDNAQIKSSFFNGNLVAANMLSTNDWNGEPLNDKNNAAADIDPSIKAKALNLASFINIDNDYKLVFSDSIDFNGTDLNGTSRNKMFVGEMPVKNYGLSSAYPANYITLHLSPSDGADYANEIHDDAVENNDPEMIRAADVGQMPSDAGDLASAESETSLDLSGIDEAIAPTSNILDKYSSNNLKELNMSLFAENNSLEIANFDIPDLNQGAEYTKTYVVAKDDSIISIAKKFNVKTSDLMQANKMTSADLKTGSSILVPDTLKSNETLNLANTGEKATIAKELTLAAKKEKIPEINIKNLLWPCNTRRITSNFGVRIHPVYHYKKFHNGVDVGAAYGSKIKSCEAGVVVFAGWKSGYGRVVIVKHTKDIYTLYAHCSRFLVKRGQNVKRGEAIAKIGQSGVATGPHLHLGVQKNGRFVNPMNFF